MNMTDRYLKPDDVAELLGVPRATLYAWRSRGKGPQGIRFGRHLRYAESAVRDWIGEQETKDKEIQAARKTVIQDPFNVLGASVARR